MNKLFRGYSFRLVLGLSILALIFGLGIIGNKAVLAATPEEDLNRINQYVEKALAAARTGDLSTVEKQYKAYDDAWFEIEDGIRAKSKEAYRNIEKQMQEVEFVLSKKPVDTKALITQLEALEDINENFIKGATKAPTTGTATEKASVAVLLGKLTEAKEYFEKKNYTSAATEIKEFQEIWLEVEGQIKTRSADAYTQTENDMALAYKLLSDNSPEAGAVLNRMYTRLEPYKEASNYGIFDATAILLREGLEALLVVVALLTFLQKSGNANKQPWIWVGAGAGLAASIVLALVIQLVFSAAINASNRELIEGLVGLVAAGMLFYVSYWMHNKASAGAWQRYIKQKSSAALAQGSLFGLALLSFLAIFREGAETALFFLGIGPSISTSDLLIGLLIGTVALVVLGVLMTVIGLRIPMGPFFTVASVLVFFLCFKFIGTGIHALQVANLLPSTSASWLPENSFLGLYPTWETTIVQLIVLAAGIGVVVYSRVKENASQPTKTDPVGAK